MENNYGTIRILTDFYKTLVAATDASNNVIAWSCITFDRKRASILSYNASRGIAIKLKELGIDNVDIVAMGHGLGREAAIKALVDNGISINMIKDKTPVPHNGAVPPKRLRYHSNQR